MIVVGCWLLVVVGIGVLFVWLSRFVLLLSFGVVALGVGVVGCWLMV